MNSDSLQKKPQMLRSEHIFQNKDINHVLMAGRKYFVSYQKNKVYVEIFIFP